MHFAFLSYFILIMQTCLYFRYSYIPTDEEKKTFTPKLQTNVSFSYVVESR